MNRRKFIKGAAVAGGATAVVASTFPAPAIAQKRIEINMVSTWPRDFPGLEQEHSALLRTWNL